MKLSEAYRPSTLEAVIGQPRAIAGIKQVLTRGWGGRAWWIVGGSGQGKTTISRCIAALGADPWFCEEIPFARDMKMEALRNIRNAMFLHATGKGGRCFTINEAHGLRVDIVEALLTPLEDMPDSACIIFTTTLEGERKFLDDNGTDGTALISRCQRVELQQSGVAEAFGAECHRIAIAEGLDGSQSLQAFIGLVERCKLNMRMALQQIEAGKMLEITPDYPRAACLAQPAPVTVVQPVKAPEVKKDVPWWQLPAAIDGGAFSHVRNRKVG